MTDSARRRVVCPACERDYEEVYVTESKKPTALVEHHHPWCPLRPDALAGHDEPR